ncbi:putative phospholipid import ATP-binding protein MlaF [Fundidesulfovibrio magnetotacticus]|uniref:Putative phospholipid import ATP-binding protein MlaF n=1 Tax=Fundidesulfovibrio magnetotacticus TaxID=2730080 RepID=A0A6V8M4N3_9BACT|nr:ATP-binding cassette domain-containing protein [Fundidesulfovibrio magnetotacticus]GFK95405.1 putative phospholipid import ATP-binding protein MlaF [Fundidesulfovibrio magnetotacticus]
MPNDLIEIKGLTRSFQGRPVLRGVDLRVPEGGLTVVIGKSGEGKSVLLKHVMGLLRPDSGDVRFEGRALGEMTRAQLRALKPRMSYMFQGMALFDSLTVFENVALPLRERLRLPGREVEARVGRMLEELELAGARERYPSQLSGGMQKRVALARALVTEPSIVLFDEPTTGLDPLRKWAVFRLIDASRRRFGFTALMVSHDIPDVFEIATHVALLDEGRIVFSGTPEEALASEHPVLRGFMPGREGVTAPAE